MTIKTWQRRFAAEHRETLRPSVFERGFMYITDLVYTRNGNQLIPNSKKPYLFFLPVDLSFVRPTQYPLADFYLNVLVPFRFVETHILKFSLVHQYNRCKRTHTHYWVTSGWCIRVWGDCPVEGIWSNGKIGRSSWLACAGGTKNSSTTVVTMVVYGIPAYVVTS